MNTEARVEQVTGYLRGLSATLADMMLEDAADLIDELYAATFVLAADLNSATWEGPGKKPRTPRRKTKPAPGESFGEIIKEEIRKRSETAGTPRKT